jgi:hypothetical protein
MTKLLLTLTTWCLIATTAIAQIPSYVPSNGLVGWWPFNGNANDASENVYNGTVNGATLTTDRFGNVNKAYFFDGIDDEIITNLDSLKTNKLTISFYVKFDTTISHGLVMMRNKVNHLTGFQMYLGNLWFQVDDTCDSYVNGQFQWHVIQSERSKNKWKDKNWHHIVGSYDGVKMRVYIDGVKSDSLEADITSISSNSSFIFGHDNSWASNNYFEGKLDDIGIWNRALTESEVTALFNANICIEKISVTDTLIISVNRTGFSPISFENTLKVYPNPTKDKITIDNGNLSKMNGYSVKIMNSLGQQVFQSAINQQQFIIDITAWGGNGMYFLQLIDSSGNITDIRKLLLQ